MGLERLAETRHDADIASLRLALFTDSFVPQLNGVALVLERLVEAVRARGYGPGIYDERSGWRPGGRHPPLAEHAVLGVS